MADEYFYFLDSRTVKLIDVDHRRYLQIEQALVVQWIEHWPPEPKMAVRVSPGALSRFDRKPFFI